MLVNVSESGESRVAVVEAGVLEEFFIEKADAANTVGNVYRGRVANVEPSLQAAFVDYGAPRSGFIHASDIITPRGRGGEIGDLVSKGQDLMVQVVRPAVGEKGCALTTAISIPGRYLVLMPGTAKIGISRKIVDEDARERIRKLVKEIDTPEGLGFIVRTAGIGRTKREIVRDMNYLIRIWRVVEDRFAGGHGPLALYRERDIVQQAIREFHTTDMTEIVIDSAAECRRAERFLKAVMPKTRTKVRFYDGHEPIFRKYGVEQEIRQIYERRVGLKTGGSIVIDQTEALVAVDVNSGRYRDEDDFEETAFRTNMEAASVISRQLRLRDLGGVIVIDFIDLTHQKHRKAVEKALGEALKKDRARTKAIATSRFGLVEMTRQRLRQAITSAEYEGCLACGGAGIVLSPECAGLDALRAVKAHLAAGGVAGAVVTVSAVPEVARWLLNRRREDLFALEGSFRCTIDVVHAPWSDRGRAEISTCADRADRL